MLNPRTFIKTIIGIAFIIVAIAVLLDVDTLLSALSFDYSTNWHEYADSSYDSLTDAEQNTYLLIAGMSILGKSLVAYGLAVVYKLVATYKLENK